MRERSDVDATVADAVALLDSGLAPAAAWEEADIPVGPDGLPALPADSGGTAAAVRAAALLSHSAGVPLAEVLRRTLHVERARQESQDACEAALAGPRMSARILAWLPLAGVGLAALIDPRAVTVLVTTALGWALIVIAALLTWCGRRWTRALLNSAQVPDDGVPVPLALALVEAALVSGMDVPGALRAVGSVLGGKDGASLEEVAARLSRGAPWADAWATGGGHAPGDVTHDVERALRAPHRCGASAVPALRSATDAALRRSRRLAQAAAGKLGVTLALPLTLCLLPAFIAVGIVPMVLAVIGSVELPDLPGLSL